MIILGLDVSLRSTGLALLMPESISSWTVKSKAPTTVNDMAKRLMASLEHIISLYNKDLIVFIEDYAFGKFGNSGSVASLIELTGILQYGLYQASIRYYKVAPTAVKKFLSGKGILPKDQIPLLIYKKFNLTPDTVDACDALAIADFGYSLITGQGYKRELKQYELDSIVKNSLTI